MKHKSTLILLLAVVIAAVVAYSLSRKPTSEELAREATRILPGLSDAHVAELQIESDGTRIVCRRAEADEDRWLITEPLQLRADRWEVEGIINRLGSAEKGGRPILLTGERKLSDYGLDSPRRKVTLRADRPAQRTWTLLVGNESGVGELVYVTTPGADRVFTVARSVVDRPSASSWTSSPAWSSKPQHGARAGPSAPSAKGRGRAGNSRSPSTTSPTGTRYAAWPTSSRATCWPAATSWWTTRPRPPTTAWSPPR